MQQIKKILPYNIILSVTNLLESKREYYVLLLLCNLIYNILNNFVYFYISTELEIFIYDAVLLRTWQQSVIHLL